MYWKASGPHRCENGPERASLGSGWARSWAITHKIELEFFRKKMISEKFPEIFPEKFPGPGKKWKKIKLVP